MTEEQVSSLISSLAGDLATIGSGVIFLALVAMGGLWVRKLLGYG